ncbi:DUF748 domain-containing protein [Tamlana sp. I1]|uniref:DUF748 domain-containing protein n=1 Tax=Tamlana sp. I1 TaxID=2762061 RepID=UPI00188E2823|nr:DUF748 domain-containing protein [Tamlana sp. I1]
MNKKKLILLSTTIILFLVLSFLPTLIKNYAVKNSKALLGRKIDINNLYYNYFSSTIKVCDFKMFEQNETDKFTTFDTLIINLEPYRFLFNEKVIEQFYIKGLKVNTILQDSTFNFDDLIAFHATEDSITAPETDTFKYSISNIELKDANFYFDNRNVNHVTDIENFSFFIPNIGWDQEEKSNADLKFNFKNGGSLESSLNIHPVDGEFDATININDLLLNPFYKYALEHLEITSLNGVLNSKIKITGNTNEPVNSIVSGEVIVSDFEMKDQNSKKVLASKNINCQLKNINYANSSYQIEALTFTQPYVYFEMDSITNNMFTLFKLNNNGDPTTKETNTTQEADSTNSKLYYAINNLRVNDGIMDYSDNLTGERFNYHLNKITIDTDSINSNSEWIDIQSQMLLNNRGTLKASLEINPSDYTNMNLDLSIEKFLLSDINIYSNYYIGHNIVDGDFYYLSKSKITDGNIESENHLMVKNVSIENTKGGLFSLPLKFALFLLKDKNGDVNLDIPVRGDLNDPKINVGKIIWTTFKNAIIKTAASPVNFLAGLVGGDPKELQELKFNYTDTIPSEKQLRKLDKLLDIESKKEGIKIELQHFVDPDLQREAIAYSKFGEQFNTETNSDYTKDEKAFDAFVKTKVSGNNLENDSLDIKAEVVKWYGTTTLDSLAGIYNAALIKNTNQYLKTIKKFTNITALKSDVNTPENTGSASRFKINYTMLDPSDTQEAQPKDIQ